MASVVVSFLYTFRIASDKIDCPDMQVVDLMSVGVAGSIIALSQKLSAGPRWSSASQAYANTEGDVMSRITLTLALASCVCISGATGGAAYAGVPDANGIIHACFKSSSTNQGDLRVIDTDAQQTCLKGESPIQWQQASPDVPKVSVSQTAGPGVIVGDGFNTLATVTVTAPTSGHVLVNAWTSISGLGADQFGIVRLRDAVSGDVSTVQLSRIGAGGVESVSVGWLFEVAAGERVFELGVRGEVGTINSGSATMTAVFMPD